MSRTPGRQVRLDLERRAGIIADAGRYRAGRRPSFIPRRPWRVLVNRNLALIVGADGVQVRFTREVCELIVRAVNGPEGTAVEADAPAP